MLTKDSIKELNRSRFVSPKVLVISGVTISLPKSCEEHINPKKDYEILFDVIHPDIIDISNIEAIRKPFLKLVRRQFGSAWAVALAASQRTNHYDIIMATGEDVGLRLAFLSKLFNLRIPLIITCHNISSLRPLLFLKYIRVAEVVHTFQCLSESQAKMLISYPGVSQEKVHLLYWHVDHHFFTPMPDVPIVHQICSAGMASRDYATFLKAVKGLEINIKIAADSPWFRQQLNINPNEISPWAEVRSYENYQALRHLYAESLFVVVPMLDVPFSAGYSVILEAMAMGKAVIASRIKQREDFIVDGWNGLYVTPGDELELREKICFLLQRPDEAIRLGTNARKMVEERFTLNHYVKRVKEDLACALEHKIQNVG